jgi:hypothetical protein
VVVKYLPFGDASVYKRSMLTFKRGKNTRIVGHLSMIIKQPKMFISLLRLTTFVLLMGSASLICAQKSIKVGYLKADSLVLSSNQRGIAKKIKNLFPSATVGKMSLHAGIDHLGRYYYLKTESTQAGGNTTIILVLEQKADALYFQTETGCVMQCQCDYGAMIVQERCKKLTCLGNGKSGGGSKVYFADK